MAKATAKGAARSASKNLKAGKFLKRKIRVYLRRSYSATAFAEPHTYQNIVVINAKINKKIRNVLVIPTARLVTGTLEELH